MASTLERGNFIAVTGYAGCFQARRDGSTPSPARSTLNRRSPTRNKTSWFDSNSSDHQRSYADGHILDKEGREARAASALERDQIFFSLFPRCLW